MDPPVPAHDCGEQVGGQLTAERVGLDESAVPYTTTWLRPSATAIDTLGWRTTLCHLAVVPRIVTRMRSSLSSMYPTIDCSPSRLCGRWRG